MPVYILTGVSGELSLGAEKKTWVEFDMAPELKRQN